ncbi:MAG: LysM peptidoglycan-binding domain-containing protein, partial [Candidatus Cryptobacteroides sp.]
TSRAGAKGIWQFMYTTAKNYGLTVNSFVDERLDPVKSADAAARYLYDAYKIFGDWNLAISSYNCGAGNVNKAIKRSGSRDFWAVYDFLPRETRGYVPAFVGAMYAFRYYREHGITPDPVRMPAHVDTFHIRKMLHFQQVSELTGVSVDMLRNLNPQYVHDIIPGNEREYVLRLPYQYSGKFIENEDSVYAYKAKELFSPATLQNIAASGSGSVPAGQRITYKVKSGDYLGRIASKYHVTVAQLKEWNHLRSNNLRIGQVLVIYGKGAAPAAKASSGTAVAKPASAPSKPDPSVSPTGEYVTYVVKEGDSLFRISKNYPGVSADDIMKFNGIGPDIRPGMTIKIPKVK